MPHMGTLIKSKHILPMQGPVITDGALFHSSGLIEWIGHQHECPVKDYKIDSIADFGNGILFPGLLNLHAHLSLNGIAGSSLPQTSFTDWAKEIVHRVQQSILSGDSTAVREQSLSRLRDTDGVTTVIDHTMNPNQNPEFKKANEGSGIRVISSLEFGGVLNGIQVKESYQLLKTWISRYRSEGEIVSLSPHAPYSVRTELFDYLKKNLSPDSVDIWSIHVSESNDEFEYFNAQNGSMWQWLTQFARSPVKPLKPDPIAHIFHAIPDQGHILLVHGNYASVDSLDLNRNFGWVHCPKSHDYFNHSQFPFDLWSQMNNAWGIGTDSTATMLDSDFSMHGELDLLKKTLATSPYSYLEKVTSEAARAAGLSDYVGALKAGLFADFNYLPLVQELESDVTGDDLSGIILNSPRQSFDTYVGGDLMSKRIQ